ncbi:universal stress protein [Halomarina oriensis]|uniref:UspA domain-containing protein n=1 Tax=Halomarina oriensis TaxID=671145 RepID=A0A6B0GPH8_9EURY|nr:universal stress protein [Halomarina oriensis]MWG36776.1 hypothetical protein [Halomarina oriensis]
MSRGTPETTRHSARAEPTNVLVSIEGAAADETVVRAAGQFVARTGGRLTVLNVMPTGAFADRQRARGRLPGFGRFTHAQAETERRASAEHVADEALAGLGIEYDCVGRVGRETNRILAEADERDCRRVFLSNRRRSSLGAMRASRVVDDLFDSFDGQVTVVQSVDASEPRQNELV